MSQKSLDKKNRWRMKTVAFHVSPEEEIELNNRVKLCGAKSKREYLVESALNQKIVAKGNPMMMVQFRKLLCNIEKELKRLNDISEMDEELLTPIKTMLEILEAFEEENKQKTNAPAGNKDICKN